MDILIAPNAFKNSLTAERAALAIQEGLYESNLECNCECFPVGDGGDGTGELINKKLDGKIVNEKVYDALGRNIDAPFGLIDRGLTAVIEMADASGIRLLKREELNPLNATSFGTGQQMKMALDKGVSKIIIGMGGSATVDGGIGMLQALGVRFLNERKEELQNLPGTLIDLDTIDVSNLDKRILNGQVIVLCDVDNLLLGENGAAAVFGPQKGATPQAVKQLDSGLGKFSHVVRVQTGKDISKVKYGGTAGGAAAGLFGVINAQLVNGIEYFLDLTGFDRALENAGLVITGEGSIDEQTLQGKGPFGVARRAKLKGLPVIGLAGKIPDEPNKNLQKYFDVLIAIGNQPSDLQTALKNTAADLKRTARELGNLIAIMKNSCEKISFESQFFKK